jgi:UDP-MurNAc hydroxylase
MHVTMLGHAALLCETQDVRVLMDPCLVGPANFRSWWHLPEVDLDPAKLPELDYIYISHLHDDHFHVPTLKQLPQRPTVLIPRLYHNRLVCRLRELGYTRIKELAHGKQVQLGASMTACCLQMGLAISDSSASMLNANDCLQGKEALLRRLIHTPPASSLVRLLLAPRFAEFVMRRRQEFFRMVRDKLFGMP